MFPPDWLTQPVALLIAGFLAFAGVIIGLHRTAKESALNRKHASQEARSQRLAEIDAARIQRQADAEHERGKVLEQNRFDAAVKVISAARTARRLAGMAAISLENPERDFEQRFNTAVGAQGTLSDALAVARLYFAVETLPALDCFENRLLDFLNEVKTGRRDGLSPSTRSALDDSLEVLRNRIRAELKLSPLPPTAPPTRIANMICGLDASTPRM